MLSRSRTLILVLLLVVAPLLPHRAADALSTPTQPQQASAAEPQVDVLPSGCTKVTPPGAPTSTCCLNGYVYADGEVIAGAEVEVISQRGTLTTYTQVYSGTETQPYFQLSLSESPLSVQPGESITIRARYSSHERSVTYTVQPGSQQVDVVLARYQEVDYIYDKQIWKQAGPNKFDAPYGVAANAAGEVYVADSHNARIQVFSPTGQYIRQWGTLGTRLGDFAFPTSVAIDADQNVFVADTRNRRIQKFSKDGVFIKSWKLSRLSVDPLKQDIENISVTVDRQANLFVAVDNQILKYTTSGDLVTSWTSSSTLNLPKGSAVDSNGNIFVADTYNHRIQVLNPDGSPGPYWGGFGIGDGQFSEPFGITLDSDGYVYVADTRNNRIQKFDRNGTWLATWGDVDGGSGNSQFLNPMAIQFDGSGNLLVADTGNDRIQRLSKTGQYISGWGTRGMDRGQLYEPRGLNFDSQGALYVADSRNNRIQKFDTNAQWVATYGKLDTGGADLIEPWMVTVGASGAMTVLERPVHRLQRLETSGVSSKTWGSYGNGPGQLNVPKGMSLDGKGSVYVADTANHRIQKFSIVGDYQGGWGGPTASTDPGKFNDPRGVTVDSSGFVYVADSWNYRIQKFSSTGAFITEWGSRGTGRNQFDVPLGIYADTSQNIWVVDSNNNRIQKFNSSGALLLSIGDTNGAYTSGGGGFGEFRKPTGVAVRENKVYVSDSYNSRIQILRQMTAQRPLATINHVSSFSLAANDTLVVQGMGQDSDATPTANVFKWSIDNKPVADQSGSVLSIGAGALGPGSHTIQLIVQDEEGEQSAPVTEDVFVAAVPKASWTMLLYLAGDYPDGGSLLRDYRRMINALTKGFKNPNVQIAVLLDGPGDDDSKRISIKPGTAQSDAVVTEERFGEQAMDNPKTLSDFLIWGQGLFPATNYYLSIANHGQAVQGIAWDATSGPNYSAYLTVKELKQALATSGVAPIQVLHLDACSMNLIEVAYEVREHANILIASQYLGYNYFDYLAYQAAIGTNTTPPALARAVAKRYADRATADRHPFTISALDLTRADPARTAVDELAGELFAFAELGLPNRQQLASIWQASRKFDSNGDYQNNDLDLYVDLLDWTTRIKADIDSTAIQTGSDKVIAELRGPQPFILANHQASGTLPVSAGGKDIDLTNSQGLSIFYPQRRDSAAFRAYSSDSLFSFTVDARWKAFLEADIGILAPGDPVTPLPGPLEPLPSGGGHRLYLPLVVR